jgi:hypothetical protein
MGDSRAHIYTPITAVVVTEDLGSADDNRLKMEIEKNLSILKLKQLSIARDDDDIAMIVTMIMPILNSGGRYGRR